MSAGAASNKIGPSGSTSKEKKVKRTRKRSRNKKRTTEVQDSSSDNSSSSDDSDDEEEQVKPKPAPKAAPKAAPRKDESDSDSDFDSDKERKDGGEEEAKRKRKRKRSSKKKTTEEPPNCAAAPASVPAAAVPVPARAAVLSPGQVGPDPNTDLRLSDQAKQAIQYAQIYAKDKSQWKFNKAKQNWLLRNALSVAPSDYDAELARKQDGKADPAEGEDKDGEQEEEGENFVPDDFVPVVTAYLTSVMGGARQRLIESLREAVNAPAVTLPQTQSEGAAEATKVVPAEGADGSATNEGAANGAAATKSVSFGNLARESEQEEEAAAAAGLPSGTDPRSVELRRARATQMLQRMGEAL